MQLSSTVSQDDNLDPAFVQEPMFVQLGRVIDSVSAEEVFQPKGKVKDFFRHFNPNEKVITDDGDEITITPLMAARILDFVRRTPTQQRLELLRRLQTTYGLIKMMDYLVENTL